MKNRTSIYKNLQFRTGTGDAYYQIRITKNGINYGMDKIVSCDVQQMLCGGGIGVEIGQACAATCTLVLFESSANWERMAKFTVSFRIVSGDGMENTSWYDIGQFYTDTRSEDNAGQLTIVAYDSMLLMEKTWTDSIPSEDLPASWPITARAWATLIQENNLATFADLTQLDDTIAFVGLDTTSSIRDVLKSIATVHGGNWTVLANGNLSLIQYVNLVDEDPTDTDAYIDLGQAEESIETSPALPAVTGVHLETDAGTVMEYGSDSGYVVRAVCNVATTEGITEFCLTKVGQFIYKPFTAYNVCIDPAIELGDSVKINGVGYQVMALDLRLNGLITATVSAPYDQEVDHEYAFPNKDAQTYRKVMAAVEEGMSDYVTKEEHESSLVQTEQSITATVSATYVTQNVYNEQIAEIQSQLDGSIQTWSGNAVPTLNNEPAVDWTTAGEKAEHVGDTYFVNSDAGIPEAGNYYRFENNNGVYSWQIITDSALTEALAQAAAAQAAADAAQDSADAAQSTANSASATAQLKGRIFVVQPTPPYDKGDLWFNSTSSDIKVCTREGGRQTGSFVSSDWVKRDKYTDDTSLNNFINNVYNVAVQSIQNQIDQKAETYYQDTDPAVQWGAAIAGIAVVGIDKIGVWDSSEHEGDLWFRTTDKTTWYFDGSEWVQQSIPDEVFDQIDGKAQIFVGQPYAPYHVGDLWFKSAEDDIKTCISQRIEPEGAFNEADWVKYNKYTDDTKANQVDQNLTTFKNTFSINPQDIRAEVEKRVISNHSETRTSFGWLLNDTAHIWYSNNNEVVRFNQSGVYVKGEIRATTGYIGNDSSGFTIGATNIRNTMTSLADTTNDGIYIGTDGIALGKGKFKVTKAGVITATSGTIGGFTITASSMYTNNQSSYSGTGSGIYMGSSGFRIGSKFKVDNSGNLTLTGGSISINDSGGSVAFSVSNVGAVTATNLTLNGGSININNKFKVDSSGNLTASSGTFSGNVYAKNIQYGGTAGTLNGGAIATNTLNGDRLLDGSIYGSSSGTGKIRQGSLTGLDVAQNTISGGSGGNIKSNTLSDLNVVSSGYSTAALGEGIKNTLTSADTLALGMNASTASRLSYFAAKNISATSSMYAPEFYVELGNDNQLGLKEHYHTITISDGKVQLGKPTKTKPSPFELGDIVDSLAAVRVGVNDYEKISNAWYVPVKATAYKAGGQSSTYEIASETKNVNVNDVYNYGKNSVDISTITAQTFSVVSSDKSIAVADANTDYTSPNIRARVKIDLASDGSVTKSVYARVSLNGTKARNAGRNGITVKAFGYERDEYGAIDYSECYATLGDDDGTTRTVGSLDNSEALGWAYRYGLDDAVDSFTIARTGVNDYTQIGNAWYVPVKATVYKTGGQTTDNITGTDTKNVNVNDVVNAARSYGCNGTVQITSTSGDSAYVKIYDREGSQVFGRWISYSDNPYSFSN